jgi:hypothetical protein
MRAQFMSRVRRRPRPASRRLSVLLTDRAISWPARSLPHRRPWNAGVDAELHVWGGMWHAFFMDPDLPESRDVYRTVVNFFARHLGAGDRPQSARP